jgi:methylmalonyl-CoA/ethylmalonyl-CoA epimerase
VSAAARRLLAGGAAAPITLGAAAVTDLLVAAADAGARVAELRGPVSKEALLDAVGSGLRYPDWWGRNWDALSEMLRFPEPAAEPGSERGTANPPDVPEVIAWHDPAAFAEADPQGWGIVGEILQHAIVDRRARGAAPLIVALTGELPADVADEGPVAPADPSTPPIPAALGGLPAAVRRIGRVHHVAVVVRDMPTALGFWRDVLGLAPGPVVPIPSDRVNIAFLPVGEVKIELVEPTDDTTGVARFLAGRGEGFHHVCFEVPDIHAALTRLALDGVELIDALPRQGAEGPVAFLHPRSCHGVLVELIEQEGGPAWKAFYPSGFRAPGT